MKKKMLATDLTCVFENKPLLFFSQDNFSGSFIPFICLFWFHQNTLFCGHGG